jgi:hypothetical protein
MKHMIKYKGGILFLLVALGLHSCMGESEEKINYQRYGVATLQPSPSLYTTDGIQEYAVTSPALDTLPDLNEGDCFFLRFKANLAGAPSNNIYNVEMQSMEHVGSRALEETERKLPDTAFINAAEGATLAKSVQFFTPTINKAQLVRGHLFVQLSFPDRREIQSEKYVFQYNPDTVATVGERRVYDLYLRAERLNANDSVIGKWTQTEALVLDQFIRKAGEKEKQSGNDSLHIRLNYPSAFNADSTLVRWAFANVYSIVL